MFALHRNSKPTGTYDTDKSVFLTDYPRESFSLNDPNNSPIESVLYYCCGVIHESGLFAFSLDCFGHEVSLPIKPEMSIVLEQLDQLVSFLRQASTVSTIIDLFEQGYEITLLFTKTGNNIDVQIDFKNHNNVIQGRLTTEELSRSLSRFVLTFIYAVGVLVPTMLDEPAFIKWFQNVMTR